jgi:pimeloyl-ACP methyl ester carboxylesterase
MRTYFHLLVVALLLLPAAFTFAEQSSCGDIVGSEHEWFSGMSFSAVPIRDCTNPFGVTDTGVRGRLLIQEREVGDGGSVVVSAAGTRDLRFEYQPDRDDLYNDVGWQLFRRDSDNYRYTPIRSRSLTLDEYRAAAAAFLPAGTDVDLFMRAYERYDTSVFNDEPNLLALYDDLLNHFETLPQIQPDAILPGSYVLVVRESYLTFNRRNPLWEFFVPTAHAQLVVSDRVTTLHFTLIEDTPPPAGASSVLFLPGIQASRLYKDGFLSEDQVWPPSANFGNDVFDLAMTETGFSIEQIYTRDVIDSSLGVGSVYAGFLDFLEAQKTAPVPIKEYLAFAYDWRFDVNDIVLSGTQYENELKAIIDELEDLASNSFTGKVTVIAHSNGGLLAKAMLKELERRGQSRLVDSLVLVGVPHYGTPKAIGTVLHGYDQTDQLGGIVINAKAVREVINNMPGVYGLLPSAAYFTKVSDPIVTFESGTATDPYRARYGDQLDSLVKYQEFMYGSDTLDRGLDEEVEKPARVNRALFDEALRRHAQIYDTWVAPDHLEVFEIVGVGLPTMSSVTYRTVIERKCTVVGGGQILCVNESEIKPLANLTRFGDATVVEASANGYVGDKEIFYFDLFSIRDKYAFRGESIEHFNLLEADEVQDLLEQFLSTSTISVEQFVSRSIPTLSHEYTVEVIDSPLRPLVTDQQGRETGVVIENGSKRIKQQIPGSAYFEFGGSKYLVMPRGLPRTTKLFGETHGGYSLTVLDLLRDDTKSIRSSLKNATVTPTTVVQYQVTESGYGILQTDLDGDGTFERVTDMQGKPIPPTKVTYNDVRQVIRSAGLGKAREIALLALLQGAERVSVSKLPPAARARAEQKLLSAVRGLMQEYQQRRFLSKENAESIIKLLNQLVI